MPRSPYFVSAEVLRNGEVKLVDDDGEIYHLTMRQDMEWPIISRQVRAVQIRGARERVRGWLKSNTDLPTPPPPVPFKPKLVS